MKVAVITFLFLVCLICRGRAQKDILLINPGANAMEQIPVEKLYAYNGFQDGVVHYRNGKQQVSRLNYNVFLDQMELEGAAGKMEELHYDSRILFITIGNDTFYRAGFYLKSLKEYSRMRLVVRQAYALGNPSRNFAGNIQIEMQSVVNTAFLKNVSPVDTLRLGLYDFYYILDLKNQLQLPVRQNLIKLYPHREKALLDYLENTTVYLNDLLAIKKMLDFLDEKSE